MSSRALVYCRTSGDDSERDSMSNQAHECLKYAEQKGYSVIATLKEDVRGVSGYEFNAPELNKAISLAEQKAFDVLLVRDVKRFARNSIKAKLFELQLNQEGVKVEFVWQQFSEDANGQFIKELQYLLAEKDRQDISEQLTKGRRNQVRNRNSAIFHGNAPLGYRAEKIDGRFVAFIVEAEAEVVRLIFKLFVDDCLTLGEIARRLNESQVPTFTDFRGSSFGRKQSTWAATSVRMILINTAYIGSYKYGKRTKKTKMKIEDGQITTVKENVNHPEDTWIEVKVPRIIDNKTFKTAQDKLKENKKLYPGRKSTHNFLLGKRVWCECGWKAASESRKWGDKEYYYYFICKNCDHNKRINADLVDNISWHWLKRIVEDKERLRVKVDDYISTLDSQIEVLNRRLNPLYLLKDKKEPEYKKLLSRWMVLDEFDRKYMTFDKDMLREELEKLESEIKELQDKVLELQCLKAEFQSGWDTTLGYIWEDQQNAMAEAFLNDVEANFESKLSLIRQYDLRATIVDKEGEYWLSLECKFDSALLKLNSSSATTVQKQQGYKLVFSDMLKLDFNQLAAMQAA